MISIEECYSIKQLNTFGIKASVRFLAEADTLSELRSIITIFKDNPLPKLVLGGGSNLLFTQDFEGIVFYPTLKGIEITKENEHNIWVRAYSGENWDQFVSYCVSRNWGGLENLSLIPGNVGACPIQNIGAYGVEVKDTIEKVETFEISSGKFYEYTNSECKFGYRDSIFKKERKNLDIITSVVFKLNKQPVFNTNYKDVEEELKNYTEVTLSNIRKAIIAIRKRKLPDPEEYGNAGSFFKNPVISTDLFKKIQINYPDIPSYKISENEVKIPAAWLIQTGGWKGVREGNTGTHPKQPLVIVNYGGASGDEIVKFAKKIQQSIFQKFGIELEMEVRII